MNKKNLLFKLFFLVFILPIFFASAQHLTIKSESSSTSIPYPSNSIYPAFVDNTEYNSWSESGKYSYFQLQATGGILPYQWVITSGALPDGLSLSTDGKIKGTPNTEGNYQFTVQVMDKNRNASSKKLTMAAFPYRSKWMTDAKFGVMIQWGTFVSPIISNASQKEINTFANHPSIRSPHFNANNWVDSIKSMGAKVLNFTAKGGDGIRYWPDTSGSALNRKTERDIVGELIKACHAGPNPIKFVAYFAPDHDWVPQGNRDFLGNSTPKGIGELNVKLIRELMLKGVDGLWIDQGGTPELYPKDAKPEWFPWNRILPIIRSTNPFATFVANSGVGNGGTVLHWPDTDIIVYENSVSWDPIIAVSNSTQKKMALEVDNLLDNQWGWLWPENKYAGAAKSPELIIESIKKNWRVGATYMLNYPVPADGQIIPDQYRKSLKRIGKFVKENQGWSPTPKVSIPSGSYVSPQSISLSAVGSTVYYTVDGTYPTVNSRKFSAKYPLLISKNTRLRAISKQPGKGESMPLDVVYTVGKEKLEKFSLPIASMSPPDLIVDEKNYYRGMKFSLGNQSIWLTKIGRYFDASNTGKHRIIIKRFRDDETLGSTIIDMSVSNQLVDSFKYVDIAPVLLEAGGTYIIASKENEEDKFLNIQIGNSELNENFKNISKYSLNSTGGRKMVDPDGKGQLFNLVFKLDKSKLDAGNLAIGASVSFQQNSGSALNPVVVSDTWYAENAVDYNTESLAGPSSFAWTLQIDLEKTYKNVNRVKVTFPKNRLSKEFQILGLVNESWQILYHKTANSSTDINVNFPEKDLRYIRIRSLKPDSIKEGNPMAIRKIGVYTKTAK